MTKRGCARATLSPLPSPPPGEKVAKAWRGRSPRLSRSWVRGGPVSPSNTLSAHAPPEPTMSLLEERVHYKPFSYPWAYDAWLMQQREIGRASCRERVCQYV